MDNKSQSRHNTEEFLIGYSNVLDNSMSYDARKIWNLTEDELRIWIRRTNALLPRHPANGITVTNDTIGKDVLGKNDQTSEPFFYEGRVIPIETIKRETSLAEKLLTNLIMSLLSVSSRNINSKDQSDFKKSTDSVSTSPDDRNNPPLEQKDDIYNILGPEAVKSHNFVRVPGAILSRLTIGGLINALVGKVGGIVNPVDALPLYPELQVVTISNEFHIPLTELKNIHAKQLDSIISAKVEMDMLNSIPSRIVDILCPEVNMSEIAAIRKRIYNTVVLGRGTNASACAIASEGTDNMPVAARAALHDIDKFKMCKTCQNKDQFSFVLDRRNGDLICSNCGTVVTESLMHEGSQFRRFEGEVDRNHHGDIANPLYSNAHNMSTTLGGISYDARVSPGFGFGTKRGLENVLRNAHAFTEMNISQFGKEEKKTRVGYKDRQKKDAFIKMAHVGDSLSLHQAVLQRAKELFAGFRDDRELVQQLKGVVAACLCEAFDELSTDGKEILKFKSDFDIDGSMKRAGCMKTYFNHRANKRSNLHSSSMAIKGDDFLNMPYNVIKYTEEHVNSNLKKDDSSSSVSKSVFENKPTCSWNLDDCRLWLLDASRMIAQQWSKLPVDDKIFTANINESEGRLVRHSLTICNLLENELINLSMQGSKKITKKHLTPRVREMGQLEIKWQQSNSYGHDKKITRKSICDSKSSSSLECGTKSFGHGKTAGQILIMKTSKKLGEAIDDIVAGEAFHRELRALLCRQDLKKKEKRRNEATMMRFRQMKRKPWLHARVQAKDH